MSDVIIAPRASGAGPDRVRVRQPFNARPVCAAGRESRSTEGPYATHYTSVASHLYINRVTGSDRFGKVPGDYAERGDLVATGRCHPQQKTPPHLRSGDALWREADEAAMIEGPRGVSAMHIVAGLPTGLDAGRWTWLVEEWIYRNLVDKEMIVDWAIHHRQAGAGHPAGDPHVHMLATSRFWRAGGRQGARHWQWLANADQIRTVEEAWLALLRDVPSSGDSAPVSIRRMRLATDLRASVKAPRAVASCCRRRSSAASLRSSSDLPPVWRTRWVIYSCAARLVRG